MSKWDESHTEPIHDTPAEKDVLIRAMEAAGYTLDTIESTDDHLRFFGEGGQTMTMAGWHECEAWLNGVVFDDPVMSDRVEMILHPERFVTEAAATSTTMRAIEDMVEQNTLPLHLLDMLIKVEVNIILPIHGLLINFIHSVVMVSLKLLIIKQRNIHIMVLHTLLLKI